MPKRTPDAIPVESDSEMPDRQLMTHEMDRHAPAHVFETPRGSPCKLPPAPREADSDDAMDESDNENPPVKITKSAVNKRLRRVMQQRSNGSYKVPREMVDQYRDLDQRDSVFALFERCGFSADQCLKHLGL